MKRYYKMLVYLSGILFVFIPLIVYGFGVISLSSTPGCFYPGNDADTKLLIRGSETVAGGAFTDSGQTGHTVTFNGTQSDFSTAEKKFDLKSMYHDGTGDYESIPDHAEWDIFGSAATDKTIDFWVKMADHAGQEIFLAQAESSQDFWNIYHAHGSGLKFELRTGNATVFEIAGGGEITDTDWHHIAFVKDASVYKLYKDGIETGTVTNAGTDTFAADLWIGASNNAGATFEYEGYIDEVRISETVRWSSAFTPPGIPYCIAK